MSNVTTTRISSQRTEDDSFFYASHPFSRDLDKDLVKITDLLVECAMPTAQQNSSLVHSQPALQSLVDICFRDEDIPTLDNFKKQVTQVEKTRSQSDFRIRNLSRVSKENFRDSSLNNLTHNEIQPRFYEKTQPRHCHSKTTIPSPRTLYRNKSILPKHRNSKSEIRLESVERVVEKIVERPVERVVERVAKLRIPDFQLIDNDHMFPLSTDPQFGTGPMTGVKFVTNERIGKKPTPHHRITHLDTLAVIAPKRRGCSNIGRFTPVAPRHQQSQEQSQRQPQQIPQVKKFASPSFEEKIQNEYRLKPRVSIFKMEDHLPYIRTSSISSKKSITIGDLGHMIYKNPRHLLAL